MNRQAENKHSIVHYLKKGYGTLFPAITNVQPQMPKEQISMFLKQAVRGKFPIVIQVNPTSQSDTIWEFKGTVSFSPKSTQVIVESDQKTITYLINAREIRHIRRLHKRK